MSGKGQNDRGDCMLLLTVGALCGTYRGFHPDDFQTRIQLEQLLPIGCFAHGLAHEEALENLCRLWRRTKCEALVSFSGELCL